MRRGSLLLGVLSLALNPPPVGGQASLPDFHTEWRWADFGPESGFSGRRVRQMMEVGDTLWALTDEGVFWFDQFSWHSVGPAEGLPDARPVTLSSTADGEVVLVMDGRVYAGSRDHFELLLPPAGLDYEESLVSSAVGAPDGLMVTVAEREGSVRAVLKWTAEGIQDITPPTPSPPVDPWLLRRTASGTIWATGSAGIFFRDEGEWKLLEDREIWLPHRFTALWEGADGSGFACQASPLSSRGLLFWDPARRVRSLPAEGEYDILSGVTTRDGLTLAIYDSEDLRILWDGKWVTEEIPAPRDQGLHFVFEDHLGDLWFATGRGLHLFRRTVDRWSELRFPFPDPRNRVNDILVDSQGNLWLATHGGLARVQSDGTPEWIYEILGVPIGAVTGLAEDSHGGVWVTSGATFPGAFRLFRGDWERVGPAQGLEGGRIHKVFPGRDGVVWLAGLGGNDLEADGGVFRWEEGRAERWMDDEGWLGGRVYAVAEGPDGSLWFGTGLGLVRFKDGLWSHWGREEGLGGPVYARVFTILPTEEGEVLVGFGPGTLGGLQTLRSDGSISDLSGEPRLSRSGVAEITRGPQGAVWVATDRGLFRMSDGVWTLFDGNTGLDPEAVWPLAFREGEVLIGTTGGGLQILNRAEENNPAPKVELLGPVTTRGKEFRVRWRVHGFRGDLVPGSIDTRYKLPGSDWSQWGLSREVSSDSRGAFWWGPKTIQLQTKGLYGQLSDVVDVDFEFPVPTHLQPLFFIPVSGMALLVVTLLIQGYRRGRKSAEAIRERETTLRMMVDTAPEGIAIYDADQDHFVDVNANVLKMTRRTREAFLNTSLGGTSPEKTPDGQDSRAFLEDRVKEALAGEEVSFEWTSRVEDGLPIPTRLQMVRFPSKEGRLVRFSVLDISAEKAAEERRLELEAQLRQSQKLEAVGQLTGGVAHDFNNLLTVIMGNLDLLHESLGDDPDLQDLLTGALEAAERSALLTQRLLAFSRRQALDSRPIHLGELVSNLRSLLQRSLGETIRIHTAFPSDLWVVSADPGQMEHALINLCVNARDAMSGGGDLYIEGSNLFVEAEVAEKWGGAPGPYLCVSVTDTGMGMDSQVRERAIDPFFTTKGVGEGSGLGLSMVYGFMRQSGGFLNIQSQPGRGTAVQLFLPSSSSDPGPAAGEETDVPRGRGESILLVEEDPFLLNLGVRICQELGYEVNPTTDAWAALELVKSEMELDLILTEVILPGGMDGVQMATQAQKLRPELKVLYTSGFARGAVLRLTPGSSDVQLISKPFSVTTLARGIRAALEGTEGA